MNQSFLRTGLVAAVCMAASVTAFAETRTWTGGGDGTSWSSADNWDEKGAPVDGADDTVVIANTSGSALNIAIDGAFSLATIRITGKTSADAVTINATELTVTKTVTGASDYGIYVSSKAPVTFNTPIVIPEGVETRIAQMSYADAVDHTNRKLVFNGAITGGGSLHVNAQYASHIEYRAANTYAGGTVIDGGGDNEGGIHVYAATPFGLGDSVTAGNGCVINYYSVENGTVATSFKLKPAASASTAANLRFSTSASLTGGVADDGGFASRFVIIGAKSGVNVTVDSDVDLPDANLFIQPTTGSTVTFNGKVRCKNDIATSAGSGVGGGWRVYNTSGNVAETLEVGHAQVKAGVKDIYGENTVLKFRGQWFGDAGYFDLNGKDQTFDSISSLELDKGDAYNGHDIKSASTAATVCLKGHTDGVAACKLNGKVSLVWDSSEGHVQELTNRIHTTTGKLIVSNGTLRVNGAATFKSVPALEVAGGTLDLESLTAASFSGVTAIDVGPGATLKVGTSQPFAISGVTIRLADASGRIDIGAGVALSIDSVFVGAGQLDGGTYSGDAAKGTKIDQIVGNGTLTVPDVEVPDKPASWTGNGGDANVTTLANWSAGTTQADLTGKGLVATFAEKGQEAVLDQSVLFKGVVFDIPGGQPTNAFTLTGAGPLALYEKSLTVVDPGTDEQYRYVVDVPVQVKKTQTWNLSASNSVAVSIERPISSIYNLTKTGAGALELRAESPDFTSDFTVSQGTVDAYAAHAFGCASTGNKLFINNSNKDVTVRIHGLTIDRPIDCTTTAYEPCPLCFVEGTNVIAEALTISEKAALDVAEDAYLRLDGDVAQFVPGGPQVWKLGKGTMEICGKFEVGSVRIRDGKVIVNSSKCRRKDGNGTAFMLDNGARLEFKGSNWLGGDYSPVYFYCGVYGTSVVDLCGFDQSCGCLTGNSHPGISKDAGEFTTKDPATLSINLYGGSDNTNVLFSGAVSLSVKMESAARATMTLAKAMTATGSFSVRKNATVVMLPTASWLAPTNGTVSVADNGELKVAKSKTFSKKMDFSLSGNGVLELAAGVRQRCADLYLNGSDEPCELGTWGATGSGAQHIDDSHFAGTGVLDVRGSKPWGLAIILR